MRLGTLNYLKADSVDITASSSAAGYPVATNIPTPEKAYAPWKSTATGTQWVQMHHGETDAADGLHLVNANFTSATIQADTAATFDSGVAGAPLYSQAITLTRDPWGRRYNHLHRFASPMTLPYRRVLIGAQTPTDGASYYQIGGIMSCALTASPRGLKWGYRLGRIEPKKQEGPESDAWEEESHLGNLRTRLTATRIAVTARPAALSDELRTWLDIEAEWAEVSIALVSLYDDDPAQVWMMRRMKDLEASIDPRVAEIALEAKEVIYG